MNIILEIFPKYLISLFHHCSCVFYIRVRSTFATHTNLILLIAGLVVLGLGTAEISVAQESPEIKFEPVPDEIFNLGYCRIIEFVEGSFGALLMVISGVIAVFSAASGSYRGAAAVMLIGSGAYILSNIISLFFTEDCLVTPTTGDPETGSTTDRLRTGL